MQFNGSDVLITDDRKHAIQPAVSVKESCWAANVRKGLMEVLSLKYDATFPSSI